MLDALLLFRSRLQEVSHGREARFAMPLVHQKYVNTTVFAFLCIAVPSCYGFLLSPSLLITKTFSSSKVRVCVSARVS